MVPRSVRKFQETDLASAPTGRVIYAIDPITIPLPRPGTEWREDAGFSEPDEILQHPGLQPVFDYAREHGHAVVEPAD